MQFRSILALAAGPALLAACSDSDTVEPADDAATPAPVLTSTPAPTAAPDGTAIVAGSWTINEDAIGARGSYGQENAEPTLSLTCNSATKMLGMIIASTASEEQAWRLDAGGEAARIDMAPAGEGVPEMVAWLDQNLAIVNALGEQDAAFMLTAPDGAQYQFPTHPGLRRVIEACR